MEFLFVLFIFPTIVIIASIIGFSLFKIWFVIPLITLLVFSVLTFTVFNQSFFIWGAIYTILSMIVSTIMKLIKN